MLIKKFLTMSYIMGYHFSRSIACLIKDAVKSAEKRTEIIIHIFREKTVLIINLIKVDQMSI